MSKLEKSGHITRIYTYVNLNGSFVRRGYLALLFTDDDFPDNQSSLEFHLNVVTSSVD